MPRLGRGASGDKAADVPRAAYERRGRFGGEFCDAHRRPDENKLSGLSMEKHFLIGMDVGSTTVKSVVVDAATDQIIWQDYQRHDTKQPEKVLEFLKRFETEID